MILSPFRFSTPSWDEDLLRNLSLMKTRCFKQSYDTFNWICVWIEPILFGCTKKKKHDRRHTHEKKTNENIFVEKLQPQLLMKLSFSSPYFAFDEMCVRALFFFFCLLRPENLFALLGATDLETSQNHILMTCMHYISYCRLAKLIQFFFYVLSSLVRMSFFFSVCCHSSVHHQVQLSSLLLTNWSLALFLLEFYEKIVHKQLTRSGSTYSSRNGYINTTNA